jgi:acetoin utilization deacetylase AcuC-like enzyme
VLVLVVVLVVAPPLPLCYLPRVALPSRIAIIDDERFDAHRDLRGGHPESPERLLAARAGLYANLPEALRLAVAARAASDEELTRVHQAGYVRALRERLARGAGQLDPDTFFSDGSAEAAWFAAGGAAELATRLMRGDAKRGVALLRPPGHHAEAGNAMGFCMLNNVAIAAHAALAAGAQRVAIIDWDVHHGNGTQHAFYDDARVLFISLHQYPFYPGTGSPRELGRGAGLGYTANVALPAQQGPETYAHAFDRVVLPLLERFGADLVLVSAGFDAHERDPLAQMALDSTSYQAMASALIAHADAAGHGRIAFLLEGGYDLRALEQSVGLVARALAGETAEFSRDMPQGAGRDAIEQTRAGLNTVWNLGV